MQRASPLRTWAPQSNSMALLTIAVGQQMRNSGNNNYCIYMGLALLVEKQIQDGSVWFARFVSQACPQRMRHNLSLMAMVAPPCNQSQHGKEEQRRHPKTACFSFSRLTGFESFAVIELVRIPKLFWNSCVCCTCCANRLIGSSRNECSTNGCPPHSKG